jgi:hypothetical protein
MTNPFFQRIQISDNTPDTHLEKPARHGPPRFLTVFIGVLLILLAVGVAIFTKTGQGGRHESAAGQGRAEPAPLDLFP